MEIHNPQKILREQMEAKKALQMQRVGIQASLPDTVPAMQQLLGKHEAEIRALKEAVNELIERFNERAEPVDAAT